MSQLSPDNLNNVRIEGPLWSATVQILELADPLQNRAFRTLFLELQPRDHARQEPFYRPGTLIALCFVKQVTIQPNRPDTEPSYTWTTHASNPPSGSWTRDLIREKLEEGALSLLLLQKDLINAAPLTCLAGEISLDRLSPENQARDRLFKALHLQKVPLRQADPVENESPFENRSGAARLSGELTVHSSGMSIYGKVRLPWETKDSWIAAPFQLTRQFNRTASGQVQFQAFQLTLERERFTAQEEQDWIEKWQRLSQDLNPRHPIHESRREAEPHTPNWVTLEIINPLSVPHLCWTITNWGTSPKLNFGMDALTLILSDRALYDPVNPPTSLTRVVPKVVEASLSNSQLTITVIAERGLKPGLSGTDAATELTPALTYRYRAATSQTQVEELFTASHLKTAFSPVETPQILRSAQNLATPEWSSGNEMPIDPAVIWGFMPLENGWAQLPVPNLTEQIYLDSELENAIAQSPFAVESISPADLGQLDQRQLPNSLRRALAQQRLVLSDTVQIQLIRSGREWQIQDPAHQYPYQLCYSPTDSTITIAPIRVPLLQGAVSLGNDRQEMLNKYPAEHPWSLTLTDTRMIQGTWTLEFQEERLSLTQIQLNLVDPEVTLNGFFWLSTGKPRIEDALPDLENWVSGLRSLPLKTAYPATDLFPAPILLEWNKLEIHMRPDSDSLPSAALQNWEFSYTAEPVTLNKLVEKTVLPSDLFRTLPLIWQRHPHLPMIQVLPLTQSRVPANYPSASRQLVPYELDVTAGALPLPQNWTFGVSDQSGAEAWPECVSAASPAADWRSQFDLPLISLSIPGLVLDPQASSATQSLLVDTSAKLPLQYRFDLPYTDELNALAQLPKTQPHPEQVSPLPDSPPPEPPQPLTRATFAEHWNHLSELASLASADAVEAFTVHQPEGQDPKTVIQNLIEPLLWPVQPQFNLQTYPGDLTLQDGVTITLTGETALEGISGEFFVSDSADLTGTVQPNQTPYRLTAGSLAAHPESGGGFRDQRGLIRFATALNGSQLATTPIEFHRRLDETKTYDLTTTHQPISLQVGDHVWTLWFRDLPVEVSADTATQVFSRSSVQSDTAQDINDPEARSREYDVLTGYEWRLGTAKPTVYLLLFQLHFYPLTLEEVHVESDRVKVITLTGRLQLPLPNPSELQDYSNAVRVTFNADTDGVLRLDDITLIGTGEWPLALKQGEATDAPLLTWQAIQLSDRKDQIVIEQVQLRFFLFNQMWSIKDTADRAMTWSKSHQTLVFSSLTDDELEGSYVFEQVTPSHLAPKTLQIVLRLVRGDHQVFLDLAVQLGHERSVSSVPSLAPDRLAFSAIVRFPILGEAPIPKTNQSSARPTWQSAILFNDLKVASQARNFLVTDQAFQFQWTSYTKDPTQALHLLPGIALQQQDQMESPGFAALTFDLIAHPSGIPQLQLKTAFVEALLFCQWGHFLQAPPDARSAPAAQIFGSSAGDLVCGYTAQWQAQRQTWTETLLLNGMLEIKNLISWPLDLTVRTEGDQTLLTLPARQTETDGLQSLTHRRHTLRILLNQHRIPAELLQIGEGSLLLFQIKPDVIWQFEAVVEHQLIDVLALTPEAAIPLEHDRRWTVVQEVRWLSPDRFKTCLSDPAIGKDLLGDAAGGYLEKQLRTKLAEGDAPALDQLSNQTLLIEASAHHWIHQTKIAGKSATTLQFLPNGSQMGILSSPQDYRPSDPTDPQWLLLTLPFLGRLQNKVHDCLNLLHSEANSETPSSPSSASPSSPLQVDPILYLAARLPDPALALIFASWGDNTPVELTISGFDTAVGRTWARLDPLSLEENWFRLQHPAPELSPDGLQSVMATLLPNTPSRLSRPAALQQAINSVRATYPPSLDEEQNGSEGLIGNRLEWQPGSLFMTQSIPRLEGLQALYTFHEGSGSIVHDVSGVGPALNLQIQYADTTNWITGGGLRVTKPTLIRSIEAATKITDACRDTDEITIEAWVKSGDENQDGPARIVTLSADTSHRNVTLAQGPGRDRDERNSVEKNAYLIRLRTSETDDNATRHKRQDRNRFGPVLYVERPRIKVTRLDHVVYTRSNDGVAKVYINGQPARVALVKGLPAMEPEMEARMEGNFLNWDKAFYLALANEVSFHLNNRGRIQDGRSWLGEYHQVALYNRALSASEISRHFQRGHQPAAYQRPPDYSWVAPGLQIASSVLASPETFARYAAATLLPTPLHPNNPYPVSLAVSPYLSLEFRPAPIRQSYTLQLVSTELLCLDPVSQTLLPVASTFWDNPTNLTARSLKWAEENHLRLCPDSPISIVRFREVRRLNSDAVPDEIAPTDALASVVTTYAFAIISGTQTSHSLAKRVFRLRSPVAQLHFREGQCSGHQIPPVDLQPFEVAPPQTIGVQPLHQTERPALPLEASETDEMPTTWPWGLSALRVSVQYTSGQQGVLGRLNPSNTDGSDSTFTLWWQAPQHAVQYRSGTAELPVAGLPAQFRATAIRSFLPVLLNPPMPSLAATELLNLNAEAINRWQPFLPGQLRYLMVGNRAGVMMSIRNQLLRQGDLHPGQSTSGSVLVSGSLPVQHRIPRPVPLPPNANRSKALQPWASYFEPDQNALVTEAPADEAFFGETIAPDGDRIPAQRLQMQLRDQARGAISPQWNGALDFDIQADIDGRAPTQTINDWWEIQIAIAYGDQSIRYTRDPSGKTPPYRFSPESESQLRQLQDLLARQANGSLLTVQARVKPKVATDSFWQTLSFNLRLKDETLLPLPLRPQFIQFEDPEYNRRLASPAAHVSKEVRIPPKLSRSDLPDAEERLVAVKLSTDRPEYNPDSVLCLRYDWAEPEAVNPEAFKATLKLYRISTNGIRTELSTRDTALNTQLENLPTGQLVQFSLLDVQSSGSTTETPLPDRSGPPEASLRPNDVLELTLTLTQAGTEKAIEVVLPLNIVTDPVTPAPEAAYALLRHHQSGSRVECVRFAWGPMPSRVELINAADLLTEVVRRRAVFQWTDSVRPQTLKNYAIQKITPTGSTHFPT